MKVLIVDDHPIVLSGCRAMLAGQDIEVADARTASIGLATFEAEAPDVTVIDINLPDESGFELARRILARDRAAALLMLSMNDDSVYVREASAIGAKGFVSKNDDPALLVCAIEAVASGGTFFPSAGPALKPHSEDDAELTRREIDIVRLLSEGLSLAEAAVRLDVSYKTATQACNSARLKLRSRTPAEMVRRAVEMKLI